ncbi:MAG: MerR family transcriptional regulator [Gammaproteobacteria bacterium]|nr:MerR family transcriptional regulator [Gammaproteobacteria bacterium]
MAKELEKLLSGDILEEQIDLTLAELCRACKLTAEQVFELVEQGVVEPRGRQPASWRFAGISIQRVRCAQRLQQDLGVNTAGVALVLDLLDELAQMRQRLRRLEG